MPPTFATVWLSRLAFMACAAFTFCAWRVFNLDRRRVTNRVAVLFNLVFAVWALAASFWYGTPSPDTANRLYRVFGWTWCAFPPLMLHFTLSLSQAPIIKAKRSRLWLALLYAPAAILTALLPGKILGYPAYRGGYWMLTVQHGLSYGLFVVHYFSYILASVIIAFRKHAKSANRRERSKYLILGWSYLSACLLGFVTDSILLFLEIDFPNMAIIWIVILSAGMIVAMDRYGFLSVMPSGEALHILENMSGYVLYLDESGALIWANPSAIKALGWSGLREAVGMPCRDILPKPVGGLPPCPCVQETERIEHETVLGPSAIPVRLRMHRVNGKGTDGTVVYAVDQRPEQARARAERRLADTGLLLDAFMARSLDGIVLTDSSGRVVRWNEPMVSMTGIAASDALGVPYWDLRSGLEPAQRRDPDKIRSAIRAVLEGKSSSWTRRIIESEIVRADGEKRLVQSDSFTIPHTDGMILAIIARDVTEERRLARENIERIRNLDHAQKMEAVGTLSGGIAHDFNNTLSGIVGAVSLIKEIIESGNPSSPKELLPELAIIERSAQRAASSVKRLLTLTRRHSPERKRFSLDEAVQRVKEFAERSVDKSVTVLCETLPKAYVDGDSGQVEQAVLNLIINAEHAVTTMRRGDEPRGGTVTITLARARPGRADLLSKPEVEDREYWRLGVSDDGVGIPRHIMGRIFDPFYTTKQGDRSSGLGLSMVHATLRQHGGFVTVESEPGMGSTFSLWLPEAKAAEREAGAPKNAGSWKGLVLVADDDDIPRETAVAMLQTAGCSVESAADGEEAVRLFSARASEWAAVLLDARMGKLGGEEAAALMRLARPELPVVLCSGFHDEDARARLEAVGFALLDKPFTIAELNAALSLAASRAGA